MLVAMVWNEILRKFSFLVEIRKFFFVVGKYRYASSWSCNSAQAIFCSWNTHNTEVELHKLMEHTELMWWKRSPQTIHERLYFLFIWKAKKKPSRTPTHSIRIWNCTTQHVLVRSVRNSVSLCVRRIVGEPLFVSLCVCVFAPKSVCIYVRVCPARCVCVPHIDYNKIFFIQKSKIK